MGQEGSEHNSRHASNGGYENLRVATLRHAVLDTLKHPPAGFEEVVATHFAQRKAHILATASAWLDDATSSKATLEGVVKEITTALARLDVREVSAAAAAGGGDAEASMPAAPSALKREDSA
jgi:hypothetical protein